ncbi:hypothetical protein ACVFI8_16640 [Agarivorans sp. MS3-6]
MSSKQKVHQLFDEMSDEVHDFIKSSESGFSEGWVPATFIKDQLELTKSAYPQGNDIDNKTGWLFARHLQDKGKLLYKKVGNRAFYKSGS